MTSRPARSPDPSVSVPRRPNQPASRKTTDPRRSTRCRALYGSYNDVVQAPTVDGAEAGRGDEPFEETVGSPAPFWTRDRTVATALFLAALALRLFHLRELSIHDPFFTIPSVDGVIYDEWGELTLELDCAGGSARYTVNIEGYSSGSQSLVPLTQLANSGCSD